MSDNFKMVTENERFRFRYFFNAGLDKDTGLCDAEGCDIFLKDGDTYLGSLVGILPEEALNLTEDDIVKCMWQ